MGPWTRIAAATGVMLGTTVLGYVVGKRLGSGEIGSLVAISIAAPVAIAAFSVEDAAKELVAKAAGG